VYNPSATDGYIYLIETDDGSISRIKAQEVDGAVAKYVTCVEGSSDRRLIVSYPPLDANPDTIVCAELSTGSAITGKDQFSGETTEDAYFYTEIETPEVYLVPEGNKARIMHLIIRTYCDGTSQSTNPTVAVLVRSLEDTAWHSAGDTNGTILVQDELYDGDAPVAGTGTAWSSTLGIAGLTVYETPCLATQARVYVGSTLQVLDTDYTITGTKEITFGSATGDTVYAYWENEPSVRVAVGDMIETDEGWHRITAINDFKTMELDHYPTAADETASHHPAGRMPVGEGEIKIGLDKLVEGVRIRIIVLPDASGDATVAKVHGVVVGFIPCGTKKVEV
jgi:hypothetical protein